MILQNKKGEGQFNVIWGLIILAFLLLLMFPILGDQFKNTDKLINGECPNDCTNTAICTDGLVQKSAKCIFQGKTYKNRVCCVTPGDYFGSNGVDPSDPTNPSDPNNQNTNTNPSSTSTTIQLRFEDSIEHIEKLNPPPPMSVNVDYRYFIWTRGSGSGYTCSVRIIDKDTKKISTDLGDINFEKKPCTGESNKVLFTAKPKSTAKPSYDLTLVSYDASGNVVASEIIPIIVNGGTGTSTGTGTTTTNTGTNPPPAPSGPPQLKMIVNGQEQTSGQEFNLVAGQEYIVSYKLENVENLNLCTVKTRIWNYDFNMYLNSLQKPPNEPIPVSDLLPDFDHELESCQNGVEKVLVSGFEPTVDQQYKFQFNVDVNDDGQQDFSQPFRIV